MMYLNEIRNPTDQIERSPNWRRYFTVSKLKLIIRRSIKARN